MSPDREHSTVRPIEVSPAAGERGSRLDRFLASHVPELSRSRIKALIEEGHVSSGGRTIADASHRVKPGSAYVLTVPEAAEPEPEGQSIPLNVVYEDAHLIVIDKQAGLVVHPAPGNPDRTLVNALIHHCGDSLSGIGGVRRPGIVHRLDKDTSGLMVAAKTDAAHAGLVEMFSRRDVGRLYRAVVRGCPKPREGRVEGDIGRDPRNRKRMAVVARGGKPAATHYRVLETFGDFAALVECRLETGRTHQIRVHMLHLGHPLIGDPVYGRLRGRSLTQLPDAVRETVGSFSRQALHAATLEFRHPVTGAPLQFKSELPNDMIHLIDLLRQVT